MDNNAFHEVAGKKSFSRSCFALLTKDDIIDKLNAINVEGATPLDVAIDYDNWNMLQLFMQFNLNEDTIIKAIGELLSHYWHIGSSIIDKFIFQLIIKKGYLSKQECNYLLERAFDGNAWPFVKPLLNFSDLPQHRIESYFHWQVSDNSILKTALATLLTEIKGCDKINKSIFIYSDDKLRINQSYHFLANPKRLFSFIHRKRRIVTKRMKKEVRMSRINYRLIKRLMYMY